MRDLQRLQRILCDLIAVRRQGHGEFRRSALYTGLLGSLTLNHLKISRKARNGFIFCQI